MEIKFNNTIVKLIRGDITHEKVDAIVNAANSSLMGGGGVDGAIHRAGGPSILEECKIIVAKQGRLPTGEAVITTGGNLPCKFVIHTVGPVWNGGEKNEPILLQNAYYNSLKIGALNKINSIAFPSISTGIYGYPIEKASIIALNTVKNFLENENHSYQEIRFIVFSEIDYLVYQKLFK
ncbi:MAG: O-acetyl-ADP-ribose deacetylase [Candidatus Lokiarchaeota archaeon]|nr:O-acetyl-ADP-ribose deacetylase [Candidatus Lokiarchaeota archaeon]